MNSCLYFGEVSHHRKSPKKHDLNYQVYMGHLFLDELADDKQIHYIETQDKPVDEWDYLGDDLVSVI